MIVSVLGIHVGKEWDCIKGKGTFELFRLLCSQTEVNGRKYRSRISLKI